LPPETRNKIMGKEISIEQYPYEMYCLSCDFVAAYLDHKPEPGSPIVSKGAILLDGTFPKPGDELKCDCSGTNMRHGWAVRDRAKLSKCCNARMVAGGVQCEACGSNGE